KCSNGGEKRTYVQSTFERTHGSGGDGCRSQAVREADRGHFALAAQLSRADRQSRSGGVYDCAEWRRARCQSALLRDSRRFVSGTDWSQPEGVCGRAASRPLTAGNPGVPEKGLVERACARSAKRRKAYASVRVLVAGDCGGAERG